MLLEFTTTQLFLIILIFIWSGFVRSGLGFGGAALALPFMLFIHDQPIFWLPVIGIHLLLFSALTLRTRFKDVAWRYLLRSMVVIVPSAIAGVFGLISLPSKVVVIFIYSVTLFYALMWLFSVTIHSSNLWVDRFLLIVGGYITGSSLTGAPLIVAVYMRNIIANQLRNTLLVLWFFVVGIKVGTFTLFSVNLQLDSALILLPAAAIGHIMGLKAHDVILKHDRIFKRLIGGGLTVISILGLWSSP